MVNIVGIENGKTYFSSGLSEIGIYGVSGDKLHVRITEQGTEIFAEDYYAVDGDVILYEVDRLLKSHFRLNNPAEATGAGNWHGAHRLSLEFAFTDNQGTVRISCYAFFCRVATPVTPADALFLTHEHTMRTAPDRMEFLTFMTLEGVTVEIGVAYLDQNRKERYKLVAYNLLSKNWMETYRLSLKEVSALSGIGIASILYYDVLMKQDGVVKDKVRFIHDTRQYRHAVSFIYQNAFGMPETMTFTGLTEYVPELEGELADLLLKSVRTESRFVDIRTVNSGYLNARQYAKLLDLVTSDSLCLYDDGKATEIVITDMDFQHKPTGNEKINVSLTFRKAARRQLAFDRTANVRQRIFDKTFDHTFE